MKASSIVSSSNAGEFSPYMEGRVDIAKYPSACKLVENFLPLIQGALTRRGGTYFMTETKNSAHHSHLLKFEFSATESLQLEFGDRYVRFTADHGQVIVTGVAAWSNVVNYVIGDLVVQGGINYYCITNHVNHVPPNATYWYALTGNVYEIPSPYAIADLTNADGSCALDVEQSGDVLYLANATSTYKVKTLTRFADTRWIFDDYDPDDGPFDDQNISATTLIASAQTGAVTITASLNAFVASDVGRLVRLASENLTVEPFEVGKAYVIGNLTRFDGKTYIALTNATSGTSPPIHERGNAFDGKGGVNWAYQNSGYGVARITVFTDATHVTADVIVNVDLGLNLLPADVVSTSTTRWQLGAWSMTTGYPTSLTQWSNRLWLGLGIKYFGSVADDFASQAPDFFGLQEDDSAINRTLTSADVNDIEWMVGCDELIIGTGGGEFVVSQITQNLPFGPFNVHHKIQTKKRTKSVKPLLIGSTLLFLQRAGRKLMAYDYRFEIDKYAASDMSVLADRITRSGIIGMCYQNEPFSLAWTWLANGKLLGFTYDKDQDVNGWHRHPIGGSFSSGAAVVESCVVTPAPDGSRDELTLQVKRTINGVTKRYIEYMQKPWEGEDQDGTPGDAQEDAFYVDCGLTYRGAPVSTVFIPHLQGQTVQILVDGATHPDKVAALGTGAIALDRAGSVVHAGLRCDARVVRLRIDGGAADGTSQGKIKRIHKMVVRLVDSLMARFGMFGGRLDQQTLRAPATPMGSPNPIRSGDIDIDFPGTYDKDCMVEVVCDQPLPMTIAAMMPRYRSSDP